MPTHSASELRKFGLTVGGAFAVLGLISRARGHTTAPQVLWTLAILLAVPGLVAPTLLGPVQRGWLGAAAVLGHINTRVILSVIFYVVLTPIGLVLRLFHDPMQRSLGDRTGSLWIKREPQPGTLESYERQF